MTALTEQSWNSVAAEQARSAGAKEKQNNQLHENQPMYDLTLGPLWYVKPADMDHFIRSLLPIVCQPTYLTTSPQLSPISSVLDLLLQYSYNHSFSVFPILFMLWHSYIVFV